MGIKSKRSLSGLWLFDLLKMVLAVAIGLGLAVIVIFAVSEDPSAAIQYLILGPTMRNTYFANVIEMMIPLIFTGVGIAIMFSANMFNLAAEGIFFAGGVAAAFIAVLFKLPPVIHPIVAILGGALIGLLINIIPAVLKYRWNASELVSSLMVNYICLYLGLFFINTFLRDPNAGALVSFKFAEASMLMRLIPKTRIHVGLIISLLTAAFGAIFMYRTKWGYQIQLTGKNQNFAKYSGIGVGFIAVISQLIGGAIAGVGGAIEVLGMYDRFSWQALTGHGFDGVIVVIFARKNPALVPVAAFFLAYIRIGADLMSRKTDVPTEIIVVVQALIIVLLLAEQFLAKQKQKIIFKKVMEEASASAAE